MSDELLGYTEMDGVVLIHIAPVLEGGYVDHLSLRSLCHNIIPRARIQLGVVDSAWKKDEVKFKTAVEAVDEWRHETGLCPKCRVRIDVLARKERSW